MRAALCLALVACSPPATSDAPVAPAPPDELDARCVEAPAHALAILADGTCPWALVLSDSSGLAVHELAKASPRAFAVVPPPGCEVGCEWRGLVTEVGPVLVATRPSRISETAEEAWVGAALGGVKLLFAPLWYDRSALGDVTPLGPSHTLAPWVCGKELVLAPEPRLAGAAAEEPSEGLRAAAGAYAITGDELVRSGPAEPRLTNCVRVAVDLP